MVLPEVVSAFAYGEGEHIVRLLMAALLGGCIGYERERLSWAAGLRTHMLVCVGSCLVMVVSAYGFADLRSDPSVRIDPTRMGAQVVSGIGFLGAGAIMLRGEIIKGLTTAASLWAVAAVGLAVGAGMYMEASAATIVMLVILAWLKPLSEHTRSNYKLVELHVRADHGSMTLQTLGDILGQKARRIRQIVTQSNAADPEVDEVVISFPYLSPKEIELVVGLLQKARMVREVKDVRA